LKNRARRRLALAFALKQPADLRATVGDKLDQLWPYYERNGYLPVDVLRGRRINQPMVVPGPVLSKEIKPLHQSLGGALLPTQPIPIRRKVVQLLNRKPETILDDIHPVKKPADVTISSDGERSQVVFLYKDEPYVGSTRPSTLEDLLDVEDLPQPMPIFQYSPERRERKLVQFSARRYSIFGGSEDYTVVLTRRYLRLKFRSRRKSVEIPREQIFWVRLNERGPALTVSTLFEDFRICAPKSDLRDTRDLLLGM
jgi:hypothetical protein